MEKNKVINVCHVTSAHSRYDGRIFLKQCSSLAKNNYNVTLLCCDTLDDEVKNKVNVVSIDKHFSSLRDRIFNSKRMLKKNAYVYATGSKRANKKVIKKGSIVTTDGSSFKFANSKTYYRIGKGKQYVRVANFE